MIKRTKIILLGTVGVAALAAGMLYFVGGKNLKTEASTVTPTPNYMCKYQCDGRLYVQPETYINNQAFNGTQYVGGMIVSARTEDCNLDASGEQVPPVGTCTTNSRGNCGDKSYLVQCVKKGQTVNVTVGARQKMVAGMKYRLMAKNPVTEALAEGNLSNYPYYIKIEMGCYEVGTGNLVANKYCGID